MKLLERPFGYVAQLTPDPFSAAFHRTRYSYPASGQKTVTAECPLEANVAKSVFCCALKHEASIDLSRPWPVADPIHRQTLM